MRAEGYHAMDVTLRRWPGAANVLDVGSCNVNGTFRPLIEQRGWGYTGLDIAPGPNVDVVANNPYHFPFDDGSFDVVISGYCMEHVKSVWRWVPELARVLRPGGLLIIITHWQFMEHRYPVDCWRILPDGMAHLFDETGALLGYEIRMYDQYDILGVAWKAGA